MKSQSGSAKIKTAKQIERHFKGVANHRRIEIIIAISRQGGITVDQIAKSLNCNFKTISEHTQRLFRAGLINKKYSGREVRHSVSPYGRRFASFLKTFLHS